MADPIRAIQAIASRYGVPVTIGPPAGPADVASWWAATSANPLPATLADCNSQGLGTCAVAVAAFNGLTQVVRQTIPASALVSEIALNANSAVSVVDDTRNRIWQLSLDVQGIPASPPVDLWDGNQVLFVCESAIESCVSAASTTRAAMDGGAAFATLTVVTGELPTWTSYATLTVANADTLRSEIDPTIVAETTLAGVESTLLPACIVQVTNATLAVQAASAAIDPTYSPVDPGLTAAADDLDTLRPTIDAVRAAVVAKQGTGTWPAYPGAGTASLADLATYLLTVP